MITTITKTAAAEILGAYTPTAIDAAKASADFTIEGIAGSITTIQWSDGRVEFVQGDRRINVLKAHHNWMSNF